MSLRKKEEYTIVRTDRLAAHTKRTSHLLLVVMMILQLIFPAVLSVRASSEDDAIEPTTVEVQAQEDNSDADIESTKSLSVSEEPAEEVEEVKEPETPPAPAPEEKEEPAENVVDEPVNDPEENTKEEANAPPAPETPENPKVPEAKPEPKSEPALEPEEVVEEDVEEEFGTEAEFDPMLDGFPATPHPANPTPITRFAPGSLGSGLTLLRSSRMMQSTSDLEPGEVRTSKTAERVPGMVNTWDITVRIEGRDNDIVETTDVVLVLDRSGSMAGTRLTNLKEAGRNFIDQTIPFDENIQIAIVSYSSQYQGAPLIRIDHQFSKNVTSLKAAINNLVALGGTHTQAGIIQGRELLTGSDADNKYMILLSDGEPTYSYEPTNWISGRPSWGTTGGVNNSRQLTAVYDGSFNTGTVVGTGSALTQSYTTGSGSNQRRRHIHNGDAAVKAGQDARVGIDTLFTIGIQLDTTTAGIMSQIASPNSAYLANQPSELPGLYNKIRTEIMTQSALRDVTLIDEMGDGFSLVDNTLSTTEGLTTVADADITNNDTITWTIAPYVEELVDGPDDVRYAEMTYRVEVNDGILALDGAKTDEHKLFDTNKRTELSYKDINDDTQTKSITSPKVDPVLLKMKKNLLDADPNEERRFDVEVSKASPDGFNHTESLVPNADYVWLTSLRHEGTYGVAETGISGPGITDLNQFITTYEIDGVNKTNFTVNHLGEIPRGDITIEVTNREIALIDITATKVWDGGPTVKPNIQLQLYRNGTAYGDPVTLESGTTTYTWPDLDEADSNGNIYTYTVQEVEDPENYNSVADGLIVTNTYIIPTTGTASATKIWEGGTADEYYEIDLTLWRTKDGLIFLPVEDFDLVVTASADGTTYNYEWSNLETTDSQGSAYTFYFTEDNVPPGYARTYSDPTLVGDAAYQASGGIVTNRKMNSDFSFTKVDELGNSLTGASFTLTDENDELIPNVGMDPQFAYEGLTAGTYTLTETSAPDGYYLQENASWTFDVIWNETTNQFVLDFAPGDELDLDDELGYVIANYPEGMLPETGGPGTRMFLLVGLLSLMTLSVMYGWQEKRNGGSQMTKKISLFLVLILSIASFGSMNSPVEAQTEEDVTFILHKVLFDFGQMPTERLNTGNEMSEFSDYETLNGAEFEVYDVTAEFQALISRGQSMATAQRELASTNLTTKTPVDTEITRGEGIAEFTLPSGNGHKAYLFHESDLPAGINERATNLVVILPVANAAGIPLSTIHLYPKNESESILLEKEVLGDVSYAIGEPIAYEITTRTPRNPQDYTRFTIRDEADSVLLFNEESLVVTIDGRAADGLYTLNPNLNGFTLNFDVEALANFRNQEILVRYEMALSPEALPDSNYVNEASVEYGNQVTIDRDFVRTGGYRFVKVDLRNENITLANARFILRNDNNNYLLLENGTPTWITNRANATQLVSRGNGAFEIGGLRYGRYYLEEIEAPEGYVLSDTEIPFNVMNGTFSLRAAMNVVNQPDRPRLPITGGDVPTPERPRLPITRGEEPARPRLPFTAGVERPAARPRLPITGEMNTIIFGVIGVAFIVLALVILNSRKREEREEK